jgi:hypothetical protein
MRLTQRLSLAGHALAVGLAPILIVLQPRLIVQVLLPADIGRIPCLKTDRPLRQRPVHEPTAGVPCSAVCRVQRGTPVNVGTGIGRVVQDGEHAARAWPSARSPHAAQDRAAGNGSFARCK